MTFDDSECLLMENLRRPKGIKAMIYTLGFF